MVRASVVAGCAGPAAGGAAGVVVLEAPMNWSTAACAWAFMLSTVWEISSDMVCRRLRRPWPGLAGLGAGLSSALTEMPAGEMVPPWGFTDTRPGVTAIRAGAMLRP